MHVQGHCYHPPRQAQTVVAYLLGAGCLALLEICWNCFSSWKYSKSSFKLNFTQKPQILLNFHQNVSQTLLEVYWSQTCWSVRDTLCVCGLWPLWPIMSPFFHTVQCLWSYIICNSRIWNLLCTVSERTTCWTTDKRDSTPWIGMALPEKCSLEHVVCDLDLWAWPWKCQKFFVDLVISNCDKFHSIMSMHSGDRWALWPWPFAFWPQNLITSFFCRVARSV